MFYTGNDGITRWNDFVADMFFNALITAYFVPYMYLGKRDKMIDTFKSICKI